MLDATKPHQCAAMIVAAGMPRAGSTSQMKLLMTALQLLNISVAHQGYWDYAEHIRMGAADAARYYDREYATWAKLKRDDVIVYKSHEYAPNAIGFCNKTVVLTIHRCLENELRSAVGAGFISPNASTTWMMNMLTRWMTNYAAWKTFGALDFAFEEYVTNPQMVLHAVVSYLAVRLEMSPSEVLRRTGSGFDFSRVTIGRNVDHTGDAGAASSALSTTLKKLSASPEDVLQLQELGLRIFCDSAG